MKPIPAKVSERHFQRQAKFDQNWSTSRRVPPRDGHKTYNCPNVSPEYVPQTDTRHPLSGQIASPYVLQHRKNNCPLNHITEVVQLSIRFDVPSASRSPKFVGHNLAEIAQMPARSWSKLVNFVHGWSSFSDVGRIRRKLGRIRRNVVDFGPDLLDVGPKSVNIDHSWPTSANFGIWPAPRQGAMFRIARVPPSFR